MNFFGSLQPRKYERWCGILLRTCFFAPAHALAMLAALKLAHPSQLLMICTPEELTHSTARSTPKSACSSARPIFSSRPTEWRELKRKEGCKGLPPTRKVVTARLGTALLISYRLCLLFAAGHARKNNSRTASKICSCTM